MTKPFLLQLEIPRRSKVCAHGEEPLSQGMEYISMLNEEKGIFVRRDFCLHCWEANVKQQASSVWRSKVPEKQELDLAQLNHDERAMALLKECIEKKSDQEAFILAVYLARKRQLVLRDELEQDGVRVFLYENPATEEILCVRKIDLSQLQIQTTQKEIANKLKGK